MCCRVLARKSGVVSRAFSLRVCTPSLQAGTLLFPDNAFVSVLYANFLLDNLGFSQTGRRQMEVGTSRGA